MKSLDAKCHQMSELDQAMTRIINTADLESRGHLTAEQRTEFDEASTEFDVIMTGLTKPEKVVMAERQLENARGRKTAHDVPGGPITSTTLRSFNSAVSVAGGKSYRSMFPSEQLDAGAWKSFDGFLQAVQSGRSHDQLMPSMLAASGGVASQGGFLVPEEFSAEMLDRALESEIVRPRADVRPMTTDVKKSRRSVIPTHLARRCLAVFRLAGQPKGPRQLLIPPRRDWSS